MIDEPTKTDINTESSIKSIDKNDDILDSSFQSTDSNDDGLDHFKLSLSSDNDSTKNDENTAQESEMMESQMEIEVRAVNDSLIENEKVSDKKEVGNIPDEGENKNSSEMINGVSSIDHDEKTDMDTTFDKGNHITKDNEENHVDNLDNVEEESPVVELNDIVENDEAAGNDIDKEDGLVIDEGANDDNQQNDVVKYDESIKSPTSAGLISEPASVSARSASLDSEGPVASEESRSSTTFASESGASDSRCRKRPSTFDIESTLPKRPRVDKRHCSDGEQECDNTKSAENKRRSSLSEADLLKDIQDFSKRQQVSNSLKDEKWKPVELTEEEKKHLIQASAREKNMRENVLRVIQRNYKELSVEDFEDCIYVAMMNYFCHYNSSSVLQRKVLMLEKLVSKLQENYNRTFKQFCESKYLLRRMVEIRKEEMNNCICKDKLPFKLIRSVAVQVQTSRCRGGDLCPGSGVGLDPKFKMGGSASSSKNVFLLKKGQSENLSASLNKDDVSMTVVASKVTKEGGNSSLSNADSESPKSPPSGSTGDRPRHISVSVPPPPPPSRWANRTPAVRARPSSELQHTSNNSSSSSAQQKTTAKSPAASAPYGNGSSNPSTPTKSPATPTKINNAIVIDLTDKDEEQVVPVPARAQVNSKLPQTTTPTTQPTRVVKTSVLSPMPQLPPLPSAPLYKSVVKRPPQPVLKVCKADQSGIMLSWTLRTNIPLVNEISLYQVYACQENAGVTREWSTVGEVKALPLPMACTLSQFREGHRYHFVVRAVDRFKVLGEFSHPASILLVSKNGAATHALAANTANPRR